MMRYIIALMVFGCIPVNAAEQRAISLISSFNAIPAEDQKEIKLLFRDLFFNDSFSYSLFGNKPMSFSTQTFYICSPEEDVKLFGLAGYCLNILEPYSEPGTILKSRWKIWDKYKNQFNLKNYCWIKKKLSEHERLFFINKEAFKLAVSQHIDLFKRILGDEITSEKLLEQIIEEDRGVFDVLNKHQGLLGILLGFGRHNAMLFQKRDEISDYLGTTPYDPEFLQNKIDAFYAILQPLHEYDVQIFVASTNRVGFVADSNHPETIRLKNEYDELTKKINSIYFNDNWFEQTLLQLTSALF